MTITLIIAALAAPTAWAQKGPRGSGQRAGSCSEIVAGYFAGLDAVPLTAAEEAAVQDLREEEKLDRSDH